MDWALGPAASAAGYRLVTFDQIGSTNTEAMERARAGDPGALWIASTLQTQGRGRRGRVWDTPRGNLATSLLTIVSVDPARAATLGFVASLALENALRAVAPSLPVRVALDGATPSDGRPGDRIELKWPNDVLAGGAKLSGILLEAERLDERRLAVVVGIGVNVVAAPQGLPYPATSLRDLGWNVSAEMVLAALTQAWVPLAQAWDEGRGLSRILPAWLERAAGLGGPVAVKLGHEIVRGVFETVDTDGQLVVRGEDGRRRAIAAGEVHFGAAASA